MSDYIVGDSVRLGASFTDTVGTATDPTTVTLEILPPSGTKVTYTYSLGEITRSSAGVFYKDIALTAEGYWFFEWQGTGTVPKVANDKLYVHGQQIA